MAQTLHEAFASTFDALPPDASMYSQQFAATQPLSQYSTTPPLTASGTLSRYGFGSGSVRIEDHTVHPSYPSGGQPDYGIANTTVVELARPDPAPVPMMADAAPSRQLPGYAASFAAEEGRTWGRTANRAAPPAPDGTQQYWVQAKYITSPVDSVDPPMPFLMAAPRGASVAGGPANFHKLPADAELMTPAERREALVFEKCHDRAKRALRQAAHETCRVAFLMQKRHPDGVLGLESAASDGTLVYAQDQQQRAAREAKRAEHARARHENLRVKRETVLPYRLLGIDPSDKTEGCVWTRKGKHPVHGSGELSTNHYVLRPASHATATGQPAPSTSCGFRSNQEMGPAGARGRRFEVLRDFGSSRSYNIISGTTMPIPPTIPPRDHPIDRRAHSSNLAKPHAAVPPRMSTAPTLIGPLPDSHVTSWNPLPPSMEKAKSRQFLQ